MTRHLYVYRGETIIGANQRRNVADCMIEQLSWHESWSFPVRCDARLYDVQILNKAKNSPSLLQFSSVTVARKLLPI